MWQKKNDIKTFPDNYFLNLCFKGDRFVKFFDWCSFTADWQNILLLKVTWLNVIEMEECGLYTLKKQINILLWFPSHLFCWLPPSQSKHVTLTRTHCSCCHGTHMAPQWLWFRLDQSNGGMMSLSVKWTVWEWGLLGFKQWAHCQHACRKTQRGTLAWQWSKIQNW